jgi:multidrug resistance protein, MATE family
VQPQLNSTTKADYQNKKPHLYCQFMQQPNAINLQLEITNKQILKMSMPIAFSIIVPQLNFITNNIFLGGLSTQALAVAGVTGVYYLLFAMIGAGLNNGVQMLISRRAGENKIDEIATLFWQGVRLAILFAMAGILLTLFIAPTILKYSLHSQDDYNMAIGFLRIRIWGLPFLYLYQMRNALLVGTNQTKYLVIGTATEAGINILLDWLLIYGHWGFPNLGFNGAAVASVIAECSGLVVIYIVIHVKGIGKQLHLYTNKAFDKTATLLILKKASPLILQLALSIGSWEFFYILIEHHGTTDLAISNVMRNVFGFFGCITWAFASTTNSMVSNVIGQGLQHRVKELIYKILKLNVLFALIVCVLLNVLSVPFLSIFQQGDAFIVKAIPVLRTISAAMILMSISVVWFNAVIGTGNTRITLYTEMAAIILYCIYVYIILEKLNLSIVYGWMSEWLYWAVLLVPSIIYMHSNRWKDKKI